MDRLLADSTLYSLPLAFTLGALIGAEREWRRKAGGLRTCALVALAAAGIAGLVRRRRPAPEAEGMPEE